jgi:hypothetical protein
MVPKIGNSSMSAETIEKMLFVTEKLFEKGDYDNASFRLLLKITTTHNS